MAKTCLECGAPLNLTKPGNFCCREHRKDFNNRRMSRGAELYDLVMELRFNRSEAKRKGTWSLLCARAGAFRDADKHYRDGRPSWDSRAHLRLPHAWSKNGDGR